MLERSPLTVEMDAMNSFKVDLLASTMVKCSVDPGWRSVDVVSIRVQVLDVVSLIFSRKLDVQFLYECFQMCCRRVGIQLMCLGDRRNIK